MTFHNVVSLSSVDVKTKTGLAAMMYAILGIVLVTKVNLVGVKYYKPKYICVGNNYIHLF